MKRIFAIIAVALMTCMTVSAQSYKELVKSQKEHDKYNRAMANIKPTSADKKAAKERKKNGWNVMTGEDPMDIQICRARMLRAELMADEDKEPMTRYITQVSIGTFGTYDGAKSYARTSAEAEIAALLETKLVSAAQKSVDGAAKDAITSSGNTTFNTRMKTLVKACLKNTSNPMTIYRVLPNNQYQVETMIAYDKKQLKRDLIKNLMQELKMEGDASLNPIVDEALAEIK